MSGSPAPYRKSATGCVTALTPFLRHVNTGTLAFLLFVALALFSSTRGKDSETRGSTPVKAIKTEVVIDNFSFSPNTLTLPARATVTWTNHDDVPHNIVSTDQKFKSPVLDTDEQFSHTFDAPGTYKYFCSIHPKMTGQVVVA